jgi:integrase|tara:strand:- start:4750 stop:5403 length:654 start_codon:yes stop_codon:yes gene_type:complete
MRTRGVTPHAVKPIRRSDLIKLLEKGPDNWPKDPTPAQIDKRLRDEILLKCLWVTGFRVSEALSLHRKNFAFALEREYDVISNVINLKQKDPFAEKNILWIPKEDPFMKDLRIYVKQLPYPDAHLFNYRQIIFGWEKQRDYKRHISRRNCGLICKQYHEDLHPHLLRHSRITELVNMYNITDIIALQAYTSHSSIGALQGYIKTSPRLYAEKLKHAI